MCKYDSSDALGAGNYPSPVEEEEQVISGEITLTYKLFGYVPKKWNRDQIEDDIRENLSDYISINEFDDIEIDI